MAVGLPVSASTPSQCTCRPPQGVDLLFFIRGLFIILNSETRLCAFPAAGRCLELGAWHLSSARGPFMQLTPALS